MHRILLVILIFTMCLNSQAQKARYLTHKANGIYLEDRFAEADSIYDMAKADSSRFFPTRYNGALTKYRIGEYQKAVAAFENITESENDSMKSESWYNLGNSLLKYWYKKDKELNLLSQTITAIENTQTEDVKVKMENYLYKDSLLKVQKEVLNLKDKMLDQAISSYKNSLRIDPSDDDARYNLVYAMKLLPIDPDNDDKDQDDEEKKEPTKYALDLKQEALDLVRKNKFREANTLLQNGMQKDETVGEFNKLMENLGIIVDILDGKPTGQ